MTALAQQVERTPRERPILFSAPMVLALLAGRKTQTRRIIQPAGVVKVDGGGRPFTDRWDKEEDHAWRTDVRCPYGVSGDRLWVKERCYEGTHSGGRPWVRYFADQQTELPTGARWRPSIHMHRWASRIDLELTEVRVQRLHDISEADAKAEGLTPITKDGGRTIKYGKPDRDGLPGTDDVGWPWHDWDADPRKAYARLWDQINGAGSWAANPWAWALTFRRVKP